MEQNRFIEECISEGWLEISQERNLNANSRLFRRGGTVRKIYTRDARINIEVLLSLTDGRRPLPPEIVMPQRLLMDGSEVAGYDMPYIEGRQLLEMSLDTHVSISAFSRTIAMAADAVSRLPDDVVWGDVHGGNVIVSEGGIHIIDIDGFGLSSPQAHLAGILPAKYCDAENRFVISRNSDILGLCSLLLSKMLGGYDLYSMPEDWQRRYMTFLEEAGACAFAAVVSSTLSDGPCILDPPAFVIGADDSTISYKNFLFSSGLASEEARSEEMISDIIEGRTL